MILVQLYLMFSVEDLCSRAYYCGFLEGVAGSMPPRITLESENTNVVYVIEW